MEPLHKHDCKACIFLGSADGNDLYFCSTESVPICRYSSEGSDYSSGMSFVPVVPYLALAFDIAKDKELLPPYWLNWVDSYLEHGNIHHPKADVCTAILSGDHSSFKEVTHVK